VVSSQEVNSPEDIFSDNSNLGGGDISVLEKDYKMFSEQSKKFSIPEKPESFGNKYKFPEDLSRLSSEQLGEWMSRIGAYRGYVCGLLAVHSVKKMMLEAILNLKSMEHRRSADNGNLTQTAIKEMVSLIPEIQEMNRRVLRSSSNVLFYEQLRDLYQGQIDVLSREISRRRDRS
jgi:hypothetical protein